MCVAILNAVGIVMILSRETMYLQTGSKLCKAVFAAWNQNESIR